MATTRLALLLVWALLAAHSPPARGAETVRDERLGLTVVLPDGFVPVPAESRPPGFPFCYARDFAQPERSLSIAFRGCGVRVVDDPMTPDDIADIKKDNPGAEVVAESWRAVKLDVVRHTRADPDGVRRVYYGTSLPLQPEAIVLTVSGPESRDAEVREQLRVVLSGFEGTPSTSAIDRAARKPGNRLGIKNKHVVLVVLGLITTGVLVLVWRRRRKRARPAEPPLGIPAPQQQPPVG